MDEEEKISNGYYIFELGIPCVWNHDQFELLGRLGPTVGEVMSDTGIQVAVEKMNNQKKWTRKDLNAIALVLANVPFVDCGSNANATGKQLADWDALNDKLETSLKSNKYVTNKLT
jgi:hypothetical protein